MPLPRQGHKSLEISDQYFSVFSTAPEVIRSWDNAVPISGRILLARICHHERSPRTIPRACARVEILKANPPVGRFSSYNPQCKIRIRLWQIVYTALGRRHRLDRRIAVCNPLRRSRSRLCNQRRPHHSTRVRVREELGVKPTAAMHGATRFTIGWLVTQRRSARGRRRFVRSGDHREVDPNMDAILADHS